MVTGEIDTTYYTHQRDFFESGLARAIGAPAFAVWSALKAHADFQNGRSHPSMRRLAEQTGLGLTTVQRSLERLQQEHLARVVVRGWPGDGVHTRTRGRTHTYIARERLQVRMGSRVLCTIVVDYVPARLREHLQAIKRALTDPAGQDAADDLWSQVDILPGVGFAWDSSRRALIATVPTGELVGDEIAKAKALAERLRRGNARGPRSVPQGEQVPPN